MGQYDYSDDESVDFGFTGDAWTTAPTDHGTVADVPTNRHATETAEKLTPRQLLKDVHTGRGTSSGRSSHKDVDPGGSDDSSSDSSQSGMSSGRSNSSKRRRRRKQRRPRRQKHDPSWDTFGGRNQFRSKRQIEEDRHRQGFVRGTFWMKHDFNFEDMLTHPDTHLHLPWRAHRDGYGEVLCHPVHVARQFADGELFLSNFNRLPMHTEIYNAQKAHAQFLKTFPAFRRGTSLSAYCYEIVHYSLQFGHYVPPPFTLTSDSDLGILFSELPRRYQVYSLQTTRGLLAEAFKCSHVKLVTLDSISAVIVGNDGYQIYRDLVALSGQPQLDSYARTPTMPRQTVDQSIIDHIANWEIYLDQLLMHGTWLADRYVVDMFHQTAHALIQDHFTSNLMSMLDRECRDINKPLPNKFYPHRLRSTMLLIACGRSPEQSLPPCTLRIQRGQQLPDIHQDHHQDRVARTCP